MVFVSERRDSFSKPKYRALGNLRDKIKNTRHASRSTTQLSSIRSTLLQEKLVAPMLL